MINLQSLKAKRNLLFLATFGFMLAFTSCADDKSDADKKDVTLEEPEMRDEDDTYKPEKNKKAKSAKNDELNPKGKQEMERMTAETMPTFTYPGCEDAENSRQCTIDKIQDFAEENFDVKSVQNEIVEGEHVVRVNFVVDQAGKVSQVEARSESELLKEEAQRIISSLPTMIPAKDNNQAVETTYALPVKFKIN